MQTWESSKNIIPKKTEKVDQIKTRTRYVYNGTYLAS